MGFNINNLKDKIEIHVSDIILADVVGFSCLSNEKQYVAAQVFSDSVRNAVGLLSNQSFLHEKEWLLGMIPTGDGFYVLLKHHVAGYGPLLALSLRSWMTKRTGSAVGAMRMAVHTGPMVAFEDVAERENWVGDGLNDCARFLSDKTVRSEGEKLTVDESFIVISQDANTCFEKTFPPANEAVRDYFEALGVQRLGGVEFTDKHGKKHKGLFLEGSRHVLLKPPPPADLQERMSRLAEDVEKRRSGEEGGH